MISDEIFRGNWVRAHDAEDNDWFVWKDDEVPAELWRPGEQQHVTNTAKNMDCVRMNVGLYFNRRCRTRLGFVCEAT